VTLLIVFLLQMPKKTYKNYKVEKKEELYVPAKYINQQSNLNELMKLKTYLISNDKKSIADLIQYPLRRRGIIPDIKNKEEFLKRFDYIFDQKFIKMIANSQNKDLVTMGYKGKMFQNGLIWFQDGKITAINYKTEKEKNLEKDLTEQDKKRLHKSLKNFQKNIMQLTTKHYKIRIDELKDDLYRYAAWNINASQNSKPNIVLKNGYVTFEGSGGNHHYTFKNGQYTYIVSIQYIGKDDSLGELEVLKGDNVILREEIKTILR